jgi:hypothetical protein
MSSDDPDYFPPESEEFAVRQLHDINWIVRFFSVFNVFVHTEKFMHLPYCEGLQISGSQQVQITNTLNICSLHFSLECIIVLCMEVLHVVSHQV